MDPVDGGARGGWVGRAGRRRRRAGAAVGAGGRAAAPPPRARRARLAARHAAAPRRLALRGTYRPTYTHTLSHSKFSILRYILISLVDSSYLESAII